METSELLDLIPLYITGRVSDDQKKAIENELPRSKELRAELAFWRSAQVAAKSAMATSAEGHLRSEQIVDYARRAVLNHTEVLEIQRHLQACASCREDYEIVEPAFADKVIPIPQRPILERFRKILQGMLRPAYTVSALAAMILCVIVFRVRLFGPGDDQLSFTLQYQLQDRSSNSGEIPALTLDKHAAVIHMSVPVPHAAIQPMHYSLILSSPDARETSLVEGLAWSQGSSLFDTAKVVVPRSVLHRAGTYTLLATIAYTPTSQAFEYSYRFNVAFTE
jgi:hypothetical protein